MMINSFCVAEEMDFSCAWSDALAAWAESRWSDSVCRPISKESEFFPFWMFDLFFFSHRHMLHMMCVKENCPCLINVPKRVCLFVSDLSETMFPLLFHQDVCCVRGATGGRVLPAEERRPTGRKGHAHYGQTRPHVPPPPLGAQRRRPLHRREQQTHARHTQVTASPPDYTHHHVNTFMGSSWSFPTLPTPCVQTTLLLFVWFFFTRHILFASHSHFLSSHAWSCSCVSRTMFPETEQQTVTQMMAAESNYYRPAIL